MTQNRTSATAPINQASIFQIGFVGDLLLVCIVFLPDEEVILACMILYVT